MRSSSCRAALNPRWVSTGTSEAPELPATVSRRTSSAAPSEFGKPRCGKSDSVSEAELNPYAVA
jgi:hypothetical protein